MCCSASIYFTCAGERWCLAKRVLGLSLGCLGWAVDDTGGGSRLSPSSPTAERQGCSCLASYPAWVPESQRGN